MSEQVVLLEKEDGIATVTLNRPRAMNAISMEMKKAFDRVCDDLKHDQDVRVVILTGAGRAFCAGLDLKELAAGGGMIKAVTQDKEDDLNLATPVGELGRPVICAVNGVAITGGFELVLSCDIIIASTEARFADTHARVGILPGSGLSQRLPRLIGIHRAKELSLAGNFIGARQAEAWGLVNRVVEPAELLPACLALARDILSCSPDVVAAYKKIIDDGFAVSFAEGLALERKVHEAQFATVRPEEVAARRVGIQQRGRKQTQ
jgi:enoyl-CoA hydratase